MSSQSESAAQEEELMDKGAISRVPAGEKNKGFYPRYFLVPKKSGGMRPIPDLALFNKFIMKGPFHMLTIKHVLQHVSFLIDSALDIVETPDIIMFAKSYN